MNLVVVPPQYKDAYSYRLSRSSMEYGSTRNFTSIRDLMAFLVVITDLTAEMMLMDFWIVFFKLYSDYMSLRGDVGIYYSLLCMGVTWAEAVIRVVEAVLDLIIEYLEMDFHQREEPAVDVAALNVPCLQVQWKLFLVHEQETKTQHENLQG